MNVPAPPTPPGISTEVRQITTTNDSPTHYGSAQEIALSFYPMVSSERRSNGRSRTSPRQSPPPRPSGPRGPMLTTTPGLSTITIGEEDSFIATTEDGQPLDPQGRAILGVLMTQLAGQDVRFREIGARVDRLRDTINLRIGREAIDRMILDMEGTLTEVMEGRIREAVRRALEDLGLTNTPWMLNQSQPPQNPSSPQRRQSRHQTRSYPLSTYQGAQLRLPSTSPPSSLRRRQQQRRTTRTPTPPLPPLSNSQPRVQQTLMQRLSALRVRAVDIIMCIVLTLAVLIAIIWLRDIRLTIVWH